MFNRLTASIMRLVPAVMYQSPDNPLQLDRLPPGYAEKVELDYPVFQETAETARRRAAICLFLVAAVTPLLAWWHQYLVIPYLHVGIRLAVMLIATALVAHGALAHRWPILAIAAGCVAAGIQAGLAAELESGIAAVLPLAVAAVVLGDRLGLFYLHLKTACPTPRARAQQVRSLAESRFRAFWKPLRGAEFYLLGFLPVFVGSIFLIRNRSPLP